ncbi:BrnT family toxin [Viridibacterium curvum]|uniref:BrnT family toxin n=1 Tax=Viridibacterium curvum TaxID=1101404 RepID=A0ABP9QZI4_9RHOO
MNFTWDEAKRRSNLDKHGLDFADAVRVFAGPMVLFEDDRQDYGESRLIGIGLLDCLVVLIVHVERDESIRIISMRKADSDETDLYYRNVGYF